jgi:hypothetical protein
MRVIVATITAIVAGALAAFAVTFAFTMVAVLAGIDQARPFEIVGPILLVTVFGVVATLTARGILKRWHRGPRAERYVQQWNDGERPNRIVRWHK